jgi:hypothetical protein
MSNSMTDDYFAFMSIRGTGKQGTQEGRAAAPPQRPIRRSDTIDFVDETQIEVIESAISDTMIQRVFRHGKG